MKQLTVVVVIRIANYSKRVTLLNSWMLPSTKIARAFTYLLSWQSLMGFVLWSCMQVWLEIVLIAALKWEPRKDKWYVPPASLKEGEMFGETWPIPSIWNEFLPFPSSFFFFFFNIFQWAKYQADRFSPNQYMQQRCNAQRLYIHTHCRWKWDSNTHRNSSPPLNLASIGNRGSKGLLHNFTKEECAQAFPEAYKLLVCRSSHLCCSY